MTNKQFKAESKQLLDLMIHSIYSNKEVFLRELLSNAADALNKRYFYDLQNGGVNRDEYGIQLSIDKEGRKVIIEDTGIGMNSEDADQFLGTIAHSGTKAFIESIENEQNKVDAIGQFGVGFYSSFIVSDRVTVESKKEGFDA
ncbi:MAG: ATP-binding protein, partial [Wohlfahrtiimonas sp.]